MEVFVCLVDVRPTRNRKREHGEGDKRLDSEDECIGHVDGLLGEPGKSQNDPGDGEDGKPSFEEAAECLTKES